jgi:hypothetical protein
LPDRNSNFRLGYAQPSPSRRVVRRGRLIVAIFFILIGIAGFFIGRANFVMPSQGLDELPDNDPRIQQQAQRAKGTIARVITALLGPENVVHPPFWSLSTQFGPSALIGKSAAIIPDARNQRGGQGRSLELLLSITGEDKITVDKKFREAVSVRLRTRIIMMSMVVPPWR